MVVSEDVRKIAKLADVGVDDREIEEFTSQCSEILTYFEMLDTLPQGATIDRGLVNIFREDEITESLSQEEALRNAAEKEDGFFKAPRVM
ncbi:MAG: Asp-tRNA(Asn)/Glu-tRNA(Gln) amidotransferase subunit GatC [Methanospirillum sp.]|uniref:Asp-tRNA(Asn)/Glu-tRNA(Gln) amidotransferase subunit GatC n=1 Tax=Methanospirillum sp. TaxID=45200 RepID=UPI00236AD8EE|nr:Asp-tRNA(Asn)/Glu-tRNA(Gln) amidotransferase subunit GatC [Methanospirillum sp.]MDD1728675.1 Asp-tRNA(Asn)/Glu-tRNA(Gln) amidotransferase subunit GatC [Methanospirillum sp.]